LPAVDDMGIQRYVEPRCKSNFSFLQGASHAEELARRAAQLDYAALAITDVNTLAGVVRAHVAAKAAGLKLLIGAEITPTDAPAVLLYAPDLAAYRRLARLITMGRRAAPKGEFHLTLDDLAANVQGLIASVVLDPPVGQASSLSEPTLSGQAANQMLSGQAANSPHEALDRYRSIFGDRCHLNVSLHLGGDDERKLHRFVALAGAANVPLLASNDVHYHVPARQPLQDVLTAVRHGMTVMELGDRRFPNAERYLKEPAQMHRLFRAAPEALARGLALAERCTFSLDELRYEYPEELCPADQTPITYLAQLTWEGASRYYGLGIPAKVEAGIRRELILIEELKYEAFFLTVWDVVKFARSRGILCQGRGSAANSAVCFCLGITSVDPERHDLLFERFVSRERNEAPDIDVDFEHERREEVMQYIYQKYGRDHAGIAAEVITYRPRSAIRDVGKALGVSLDCVDRMAKAFHSYSDEHNLEDRIVAAGLDPRATQTKRLIDIAGDLLGFPRHLSQHVGGFVITRGPLCELVPIENAAMPDRTFIEWDKDDIDALGILKVDCLSLGMLTAIRKCFELVKLHGGPDLTLANIPKEDGAVFDMICRADTIGVFQIESRAQMSMLPRLKPRTYYDLVIEVAIIRPGPIQGGMVHPFLRRRNGEETPSYPNEAVRQVLEKTNGVPLFQEQVMRLAMVTAGFSAGEADQLRRSMASWGKPGNLDLFRDKLRQGMLDNGMPPEFTAQIFEQIRGFGQYGFPESHAASFALLAYVSAWLKHHHPAAFAAALLNSQPMGFYAPAQIVRDVQQHDVKVRAVDVNRSDWDCTLEDDDGALVLRLGFRMVRGFPEAMARDIAARREKKSYRTVNEVARRGGVSRPFLARLAAADAFGSLGLNRREALWQVLALGEELPLFQELEEEEEMMPTLPKIPVQQHVKMDYDTTGLSLKAHPVGLLRAQLDVLKVTPASGLAQVADKETVRVAGLVLVRQQPSTAKGTIFITLEDETGVVNLVLWNSVWKKFRSVAHGAVGLLVEGRIEHVSGVTHVFPAKIEDLSRVLEGLRVKSRDFH